MRPRVFPAEDLVRPLALGPRALASMRPRVFPAEDPRSPRETPRHSCASMRPRVFPAEDGPTAALRRRRHGASMRPRVFPARRRRRRARTRLAGYGASMRPRVFPAEDPLLPTRCALISTGFNEAAGIPRGRPAPGADQRRRRSRFNEAAGIPRGRQRRADLRGCGVDASMRPRVFPRGRQVIAQSDRMILQRLQ